MALVYRNNNVYYYRLYREGNKVKRQYMCCGEFAIALDREIRRERDRERATREAEERRWRREVKRLEAFDMQILKYDGMVNEVVEWTLINAGFYRHARTWRPRKMTREQRAELTKQIERFWQQIAEGDPAAREMLKRHFDAAPEVYTTLFRGDMAQRVIEAILDHVAGQHLGEREAILRKVEECREALAGAFPSAIETLLAERAAVLHLAAYKADLFQYRNMDMLSSKKAEFHERRRDRANRRYLAGLRTLVLVKEKLAAAEERKARAARGKVPRFQVGSGSDRIASVN
jgi:hypothetical protein